MEETALTNTKHKRKQEAESNLTEWFLAMDIDGNGQTA